MEEKENAFELVESRDALELVPTWEVQAWWFLAAGSALLVLALLIFLRRRAKVSPDPHKEKREAYAAAKAELAAIAESGSREMATAVSIALRKYLARSLNEPALFETHEEFIGRHEVLKDLPEDVRAETEAFFGKLAGMKYAPEDMPVDGSRPEDGLAVLERIHKA